MREDAMERMLMPSIERLCHPIYTSGRALLAIVDYFGRHSDQHHRLGLFRNIRIGVFTEPCRVQTVDMSAAVFGSKAGPANYQRLAKGDG